MGMGSVGMVLAKFLTEMKVAQLPNAMLITQNLHLVASSKQQAMGVTPRGQAATSRAKKVHLTITGARDIAKVFH